MNTRSGARAAGGRRPVGALETETLGVLQRAGAPLTSRDVLGRLSGGLSYSTVVTVLSRMHGKGLLTRGKQGRAYAYAPVADSHGLAARRMRRELESDPDREAVLSRFVDDLSTSDEQLLRDLLGTDLAADGRQPATRDLRAETRARRPATGAR